MNTTRKAAEKLNQNLLDMFHATDIGFRVSRSVDQAGQETCSIQLDHRDPGDEVVESYGIRLFIDPSNAPFLRDRELDYGGEAAGGFLFKQPGKNWMTEKSGMLFNRFSVLAKEFIIFSTSFMDRIVLICL